MFIKHYVYVFISKKSRLIFTELRAELRDQVACKLCM